MPSMLRLAAWPALAVAPMLVLAATPNAGDLLREAPQADLAPPVAPPPLQIVPRTTPEVPTDDPAARLRVRVSAVRLSGVESLPRAEIQALANEVRGQELDFSQILQLATRISEHYRRQGFLLAQAHLPAQKIVDGVIEIVVQEGRLGRLNVETAPPLEAATVRPYLSRLMPGQALRSEPLEHALLVLSDLPGVKLQSVLRPGTDAGTADLNVQVESRPTPGGSVMLDNHGNRYTGEWRTTGRLSVGSPWRFGDSLDLTLSTTGSRYHYGQAAWQTPVGDRGTQLGLSGSLLNYRLGGDFSSLEAQGRASDLSVQVTQPLVRSRSSHLQGQMALERRTFDDTASGATSSKRATVLALSLAGGMPVSEGSVAQGSLGLRAGRLQLDAAAQAADAAGYRTAGLYAKLMAQGQIQQAWAPGWSSVVRVGGQWAASNLDASEKFGLGGAQGVRAYAVSEASSDRALLVSAELQRQDGPVRSRLFIDAGVGRIAHAALATDSHNTRHLAGAGLGADIRLSGDLILQASCAWRIGTADQADLSRTPRLWLQIGKSF